MKTAKIAFLGGIYPNDTEKIQKDSKVSLDYAADAYQKKYIHCLKRIEHENLTVFSAMFMGNWPINSKKIKIDYKENIENLNFIQYINVLGIRNISKVNHCIHDVSAWIENSKEKENLILIVYSAGFSDEIIKLKKKYSFLKIILILPDLPKFTYLSSNNKLRKQIVNYRQKKFEKSCHYIERCICITAEMKKYVEKSCDVGCTIIEGLADLKRCEYNLARIENMKSSDVKKIFYSGTLAKKYGIVDLIDTFMMYKNEKCELIICGDGDARNYLLEMCEKDKRIKYLGLLPNEEIKHMQDNADVLINPRKPTDEYTAYSFPSKTMEYLESGNPVISYSLPGIPEEYNQFLCIPKDMTSQSLIDNFDKCLNMSIEDRKKTGKRNLKFIVENKCGTSLEALIKKM